MGGASAGALNQLCEALVDQLLYSRDPDENGTPGPVVVTTETATAVWTAVDGSITVEATDIAFRLAQQLEVHVSTDPSAYGTKGHARRVCGGRWR